MPTFGNIFISSKINNAFKNNNKELINIFSILTENNWNILTNNSSIIARCSFFMNFVNENDLEFVKDIFPCDFYNKIISICDYIKNSNSSLCSKIINICEKELLNINDVINFEDDKKYSNNDKENNIINLSDEDDDDGSLLEVFNLSSESIKINNCEKSFLEIDDGILSQKKENIDINKTKMLKKKRKGNL